MLGGTCMYTRSSGRAVRAKCRQSGKQRLHILVVLSFSTVVGIGTPPLPHPPASVPRFGSEGRAYRLAGDGVGESQFRRGDSHCGTQGIYVLCDYM